MAKRGPKPKGNVKIEWSARFAYAIGLIASDGCLCGERHIAFVSKDLDQIENFIGCLKISPKIGITQSGYNNNKAYRIQFGDVKFHSFLTSIGIGQAKSKNISSVDVPDEFFFDLTRGLFDGDGSFYSYWDKRWRSSHMFYLEFVSASKRHIEWLRLKLSEHLAVSGHITGSELKGIYQLKYAKTEALEIIQHMYYNRQVVSLSRKRIKIEKALAIEKIQQEKYLLTK
mgnify:FL=1